MNILSHVKWFMGDQRGLVAVRAYDGAVSTRVLSGIALSPSLLLPILNEVLDDDWMEVAEKSHQERTFPWIVRVRTGMSGCSDYILYSLRSEEYLDQKICSAIHVSMYGKLNRGINLPLMDIPPLLAKVIEDYPPANAKNFFLESYSPSSWGEYKNPGESSGLLPLLEAMKTMEVLSDVPD